MLCLGENYTIEEINEMISLVDDDQDGVINFQEFSKLIKKCGEWYNYIIKILFQGLFFSIIYKLAQ